MQLGGEPTVLETSSSGEAAAAAVEESGGVGGGGGGGDEGGEKSNNNNSSSSGFGGNRWPRQETLALLKIRSDMDAVFRDSSLKGPLWDEVSRKLGELGYHRNAKKCKEKFENVYKYHKRTKESRSTKPEGKKTYKFFDQLQALEHHQFSFSSPYPPKPQPPPITTTNTLATLFPTSDTTTTITTTTPISHATTAPSTNPTTITPSPTLLPPPPTTPTTIVTNPKNPSPQTNNNNNNVTYSSLPNMNNLFSSATSSSSSTASDEDLEEKYRKKRKWKDYFRRLTRQVLAKQEEMQKKFLEAIEKREREQAAQQDAWRMQEMARINREHEILVQERSTAAAKDAAVITFLHKLSGQQPSPTTTTFGATFLQQQQQPQPQQQQQQQPSQQSLIQTDISLEIQKVSNGHGGGGGGNGTRLSLGSCSSRWPKAEVHALIRLRTSLDSKYQDNGPKAPLWEDISAGMQRLGYSRSAKRCKEKWENINKYFKKVKESKRQRREDSKTCPYFNELDALYREKNNNNNNNNKGINGNEINMEPLMVQPEQQWRPPPHEDAHVVKADNNNNNASLDQQQQEEEEEEEEEEDVNDDGEGVEEEEEEEDEGDEGGGGRYEIATNKLPSVATVE